MSEKWQQADMDQASRQFRFGFRYDYDYHHVNDRRHLCVNRRLQTSGRRWPR